VQKTESVKHKQLA